MVPTYKAPETNRSENHAFNKQLSHIRIDIEHTFGMLKGRWKSLTGMRLIITDNKKYEFACMWITACVVLHNILIDLNDNWSKEVGWWTEEEKEDHDNELLALDQQDRAFATHKRELVKQMVLNWINS